jgi:hypothetical protein
MEGTELLYNIPWKIANFVLKHGLSQHLSLTYLTNAALLGLANPGNANEVLSWDWNSMTLRTLAKVFLEEGRDKMEYKEWKQGFKHYLLIIKKYIPQDYQCWVLHMLAIKDTPGALSEDWQLWLLYDIKCQKRPTFTTLNPSVFQSGIQ